MSGDLAQTLRSVFQLLIWVSLVAGVLGLTCMALLAVGGAAGAAWWFMGREP